MKKIFRFLAAAMVCATLTFSTTETKAQDGAAATAQRDDDDDDDDGMDFGWIGLIGLAGLLGLRKREDDHATRTTTTHNPR